MSPEEFDERLAYYRLTAEGQNRTLFASILAKLEFETNRYLQAKSGGGMVKPVDPEKFVPPAFKTSKKNQAPANDENTEKKVLAALGFKNARK